MRLIDTPEKLIDYQIEQLESYIKGLEADVAEKTNETNYYLSQLTESRKTLARFKEVRQGMGKND